PGTSSALLGDLTASCDADPRLRHSFPTRRSSDLSANAEQDDLGTFNLRSRVRVVAEIGEQIGTRLSVLGEVRHSQFETEFRLERSEEHTSELQPLAYLVCRLLLEKKKEDANPCDL